MFDEGQRFARGPVLPRINRANITCYNVQLFREQYDQPTILNVLADDEV